MDLISDLTFDLAFVSNVLREIECGSRARPRKEMSDVPRVVDAAMGLQNCVRYVEREAADLVL